MQQIIKTSLLKKQINPEELMHIYLDESGPDQHVAVTAGSGRTTP